MMKIFTSLAVLALFVGTASAQEQTVKVDGGKLQVRFIETPLFTANNVPEKKWRPKSWMELDLPFSIKLAASEGGRKGSLPSMTVSYYVALNATTKEGKYEVLKGMFNYIDIPANDKCNALAFAPPSTLRRILQKENFTTSDIKAWGYEVLVDGQRIGGDSSGGGPWWEKAENFSFNDGALVSKTDTPFSILWGDYDVTAKKQ